MPFTPLVLAPIVSTAPAIVVVAPVVAVVVSIASIVAPVVLIASIVLAIPVVAVIATVSTFVTLHGGRGSWWRRPLGLAAASSDRGCGKKEGKAKQKRVWAHSGLISRAPSELKRLNANRPRFLRTDLPFTSLSACANLAEVSFFALAVQSDDAHASKRVENPPKRGRNDR